MLYLLGVRYRSSACNLFINVALHYLERDIVPTYIAGNDICNTDVLPYMLLIMITLPSRVYGPKRHTLLRIFLRYVSSLIWGLGVAPASSTDGRVFLIKHITFILTGQRRPNINMIYSRMHTLTYLRYNIIKADGCNM